MNRIVITSGEVFTDIDALACVVAYAELLKIESKEYCIYLPGKLNHSNTETVKSWNFTFSDTYEPQEGDTFVVMDVSEPDHIAKAVDPERVIEIYDHHFGFADFWKEKIGDKAKIEMIGACATLIWEEFVARGVTSEISEVAANLLYTGIISNTLNLNASVTHTRDINALTQLQPFITLPANWTEQYFEEQEAALFHDIQTTIKEDTKVQKIARLGTTLVIGQMEMWDSRQFIENYQNDITAALESFGQENWFMTAPSIQEGINYLYTKNEDVQKLLEETMEATFSHNIGVTKKLWLRKEILKQLER